MKLKAVKGLIYFFIFSINDNSRQFLFIIGEFGNFYMVAFFILSTE